jgi:type IV secretory pathway TrbD component
MNVEVNIIGLVCVLAVFIKAIWIGSDFDISMWIRDGSDYLKWYRARPKYQPTPKD